MRASLRFGIISFVFGYFVACSPVKFEKAADETVTKPPTCETDASLCVQTCKGADCEETYTLERRVGEGLVDILIVNDNSGSMSVEQSKMAERFPTFLQSLGSLDYRIAMTTTDISTNFSRTPFGITNYGTASNGNGAYQDGNLLNFGSAGKYLSRTTSSKEALFFSTIQRSETLDCERSAFQQCPSGDERGIFAANLVLDRTSSEFMRPLAHLAIIILSDEDERGLSDPRSALDSTDSAMLTKYPLEDYDRPETLVSRFRTRFPEKTLSVHSIIVKPGDKGCLSQQTAQSGNPYVRGFEGYSYARLSELTGGKIGSICDGDYGAQLTNIGYYLQGQVTSLPLSCRPINDDYEITFDPQPSQSIHVTADFSKLEITIAEPLPPLTKVRLQYKCRKQ